MAAFDRGALIGPGFYADIKRTIERVGGMPYDASGITKIPTDLSGTDGGFVAPTFRLATFTGSWSIGSNKAVRLVSDTAQTVTATNLFWPGIAPTSTATQVQCSIAREGTAWTLINVPLVVQDIVHISGTQSISVIASTQTQSIVTGISLSAKLNTADCSISLQQTLSTQMVTLLSGVGTAVSVSSTATASVLSVRL